MNHIDSYSVFEDKNSKHAVFANKSGAPFWGDAGAGILPICKTTGRILVPYRSKMVNSPHTWGSGFGGKLDDGETDPLEAAKRELTEESGYDGKEVEIIPAFVFKTTGFIYHNFIGLVDKEFQPIFDWETETAEWMTLAELKKLKPKHFGLVELLKHSMDIIEKYAK